MTSLCLKLTIFLALSVSLISYRVFAQVVRAASPAQTQNHIPYIWKNVRIGGAGCWVTGIQITPQAPYTTYIRTNVGGAFRWDDAQARWISLSNHFTYPEANFYGVESLALDANAPNVVYMACGLYADRGNAAGALFKSGDQGRTWAKLGLTVPMGGNQERRWGGERLAVSPHGGRVLLFGSRRNGLWRSAAGGVTWQQNMAIPVAADNLGVVAVAFDPATPGLAYASVSGSGNYRSNDNREKWQLVPGGPGEVRRLIVTDDHSLWATHAVGPSIVVSSDAGTTWNPVPFPAGLLPLHGVISATDAKNMVVMCNANISQSASAWQPTPVEQPWQYTRDGGTTWQRSGGLPRSVAPTQNGVYGTKKRLVADPESGGTFSVLSQDDGKIYRSTDGGANFSIMNVASDQSLPTLRASQLKTQPGATNTLWAGFTQDSLSVHAQKRLSGEGLYQSTDGGARWKRLAGVTSVVNFAFGKSAPGTTTATLYIYGRLTGDSVDKIYRSTDLGISWQDITDPAHAVGNQPLAMEGSRQTFGRVFIGTNGSGIFCGDSTP